ncbi:MAG: hypothetical protein CUN56_08365, partial [Phototrophicales bacterium]
RDGDGFPDATDRCPDVPGSMSTFGCPDQDSDGIADGDDACPTEFGLIIHNGCPAPEPQPQTVENTDSWMSDVINSARNIAANMANSATVVLNSMPDTARVQVLQTYRNSVETEEDTLEPVQAVSSRRDWFEIGEDALEPVQAVSSRRDWFEIAGDIWDSLYKP